MGGSQSASTVWKRITEMEKMTHYLLAQTAFLIQRQNPYCDTPRIPHMSNLHQILQETQPQHAHFAADAHNIFKCLAQGKHVISGLARGKITQVKIKLFTVFVGQKLQNG